MMKKTMKKWALSVMTAIACTCLGVGLGVSTQVGAVANAQTTVSLAEQNGFMIESGASVRISERSGLRFAAYLDQEGYDSIVSNGKMKENKVLGMIVVPARYVDDYNAAVANGTCTTGYYEYFRDVKKQMKDFRYTDASQILLDATYGYKIRAALVDMKEENLDLSFVAIGYIETTNGDVKTYQYTEVSNPRSVRYVATKAMEEQEVTSAQMETLSDLYSIEYKEMDFINAPYDTQVFVNTDYAEKAWGEIADPTLNGSEFMGWYTEDGSEWDGDMTVDSLTAKWGTSVTPPASSTGNEIYTWDDTGSEAIYTAAKATFSSANTNATGDASHPTMKNYNVGKFATGSTTATTHTVSLPLIEYGDYAKVSFTIGNTWTTYKVSAESTEIVAWTGTFGDCDVSIENGALYADGVWKLSLTDEILNGSESLTLTINETGSSDTGHFMVSNFTGYGYDETGLTVVETSEVVTTKVAWTQDDITNTQAFMESKSWSGNVTSYSICGDKPTGNWTANWWNGYENGSLKIQTPNTTGFIGIVLPKINYTDKTVTFNMYCNWGTRPLYLINGATTWDTSKFATFGNTGDTYSNYLKVVVENGVVSTYLVNDGVTGEASATTYTLTDAEKMGQASLTLKLKAMEESSTAVQNIVISALKVEETLVTRSYYVDNQDTVDTFVESLEATDLSALSDTEKYDLLVEYNAYVENLNEYEKDDFVEADIVQTLRESISGALRVHGGSNESTFVSKVYYIAADGTEATQPRSDDSSMTGISEGGYYNIQNSTDYTVEFAPVNYKEYCDKYGVVYFSVGTNYSGLTLTVNNAVLTSVANTANVIAIKDGKVFADGKFITLLSNAVYTGQEALAVDVQRNATSHLYSQFHVSSLYTGAEWSETSETTFVATQISIAGVNGETPWSTFSNNTSKFADGVYANIQAYKADDGSKIADKYDFKLTLPTVAYASYTATTYQLMITGTGGSVTVGNATFTVAGETVVTLTVKRNGTVYVNGVMADGFAATSDVLNGNSGLQIAVSRNTDNPYAALHINKTVSHKNTLDDTLAIGYSENDELGVKDVNGAAYLPVLSEKDFVTENAGYFYNNEKSSAEFSVVAVKQSIIGISFAYKLSGVANGVKVNGYEVSGLIADGNWHTCTLARRLNDFTGMTVTVDEFVGELLIADIEYTPWTSYTVTFENCDLEPIKVYQGEKIVVDAPEKAGYKFVKWVDENGNDFDMEQSMRADVTLVAYWMAITEDIAWTQDMVDESVAFSESKFAGKLTVANCTVLTGDKATSNWAFDWRGAVKFAPLANSYFLIQLPKIDYTQKNISFNMYCNWGYRVMRAGYSANNDAVTFFSSNTEGFGNTGDTYTNYITVYVTDGVMSIKAWNNGVVTDVATTWTLPSAVASGSESLLLKFRDGSGQNFILSDINVEDVDYMSEYNSLAGALESVSVDALSEDEKKSYINEYETLAGYMTAYESEKYGIPAKIAEMKASLGTLTLVSVDGRTNVTTKYLADGVETDLYESGSNRLDYDVNNNRTNGDGSDIYDYQISVIATDYESAVKEYGIVYFTVQSNYAQKITVNGTQVLDGVANVDYKFLIHNGRLYVDGVYQTDIPTSVYNGLKSLTLTVTTLGKSVSTYQYFAMTNIYADYATYESYSAGLKAGMGGVSDIPTTVQETITVVENGIAKYDVLYSSALEGGTGAKNKLGYAVSDLCLFMKETTGADLTANDTALAASDIAETANYIVLGELAAQINDNDYSGLTTDTGYKIVRKGNLVCIYGQTVQGTLNGVYGFLNEYTGLRFYTDEVYDYNTTEDILITKLDVTFNPSIDYNMASGGTLTGSYQTNGTDYPWNYQHRLGFVTEHYVTGTSMHNFLEVIPAATYQSSNPNWFTTETVYNNGGEATSTTFTTLNLAYNDFEMAETIAAWFANTVENDTYKRTFYGFTQPDRRGWSTTDASAAIKTQYGTYSAEYILMMNKVAKLLDENYTFDRPIVLTMLAYGMSLDAPAYNANLELYSGTNVKVGVYFAPIEMNLYRSFDASELNVWDVANTYYKAEFEEWAALTDELYFWNYSENIDNYFIPVDTITNMQSKYQLAASLGVSVLKDQGQIGNKASGDWEALKVFLKAELAKNVNADVAALTKEFCDAYYGAASDTMQALLALQQEWSVTLAERSMGSDAQHGETIGMSQSGSYLLNKYCWDEGAKSWFTTTYDNSMLKNWYAYITTALEQVGDDAELQNRIRLEGLTIRYLALKVYSSAVVSGDSIAQIITDAKELGMNYFAEGKGIDSLS